MDGVIRHLDKETAEKAAGSIGFTYQELMDVLWYNNPAIELLCGRSSREDWWNAVQPLDPRLEGISQDVLWCDVFEKSHIDRDVIDFISEIRQNVITGILTNCDKESKIEILDDLGRDHPFDHVVSSSDIGAAKPDAEVFHGLLDQIKVEAEECLFFDDAIANVEGAKTVGIQAHLFEDLDQLKRLVTT
jgi:putative hydrolase of the HAD superfamily